MRASDSSVKRPSLMHQTLHGLVTGFCCPETALTRCWQVQELRHHYGGAAGPVPGRWMHQTQGPQEAKCTGTNTFHHSEGRKSCAITTARRLGQFLGDERIKDKGLNCNYVVARRPEGTPTSERAVPVAIFSTEPPIARAFLRKWCGDVCSGGLSLQIQQLLQAFWQHQKPDTPQLRTSRCACSPQLKQIRSRPSRSQSCASGAATFAQVGSKISLSS